MNPLHGIEIRTDANLTVARLREHDRHRFIEYEPKDLPWRLYFGFAEFVQVPDEKVYTIQEPASLLTGSPGRKVFVMHPDLMARFAATFRGKDFA